MVATVQDSEFVHRLLSKTHSRNPNVIIRSKNINTQIDHEYGLLGAGFESYGTYHFFVAKGVGLIKIDSEAFGAEIGKERIIDYSIK